MCYQKKLLKDGGRLHIHAKVGRFSNIVTPRIDFIEEMTPLMQTKTSGLCQRSPGGGGVLSIFVQQGCAIFQGIVFAFFSRTGYQKKANFLEQVVKTCQKRKFFTTGYYLVKFLCF